MIKECVSQVKGTGRPGKLKHWIAINGASCAMCSIPLIRPAVSPNPQTLIGFATYAEAKAAQEFCLAAPIPDIIEWQQELLEREDVVCLAMRDPEPPTSGATMWTEGEPPEKRLAQQYTR